MKIDAGQLLKELEAPIAEKDWDKAVDLTLQMRDELPPHLFHYNLGTLFLYQGNLGAARLHLEKAKIEGSLSRELSNNLLYLKSKLLSYRAESTANSWQTLYPLWVTTPMTWFAISGALVLLIGLSVIIYRLRNKFQSKQKSLVQFSLLFIFSLSIILPPIYFQKSMKAVVALEPMDAKAGPSEIFDAIYPIASGELMVVKPLGDGWNAIIYPSYISGFIKDQKLGTL